LAVLLFSLLEVPNEYQVKKKKKGKISRLTSKASP
jgi:hypothetical protein